MMLPLPALLSGCWPSLLVIIISGGKHDCDIQISQICLRVVSLPCICAFQCFQCSK